MNGFKRIGIASELITTLVTDGVVIEAGYQAAVSNGLPTDAVLVGASVERGILWLDYTHPTFEGVEELSPALHKRLSK